MLCIAIPQCPKPPYLVFCYIQLVTQMFHDLHNAHQPTILMLSKRTTWSGRVGYSLPYWRVGASQPSRITGTILRYNFLFVALYYAGHAVDRKSLQFHVTHACTNISRFAIYAFVLTGTSLFSVLQLAAFSVVGLLPLAINAVHSVYNSFGGGHYESHHTNTTYTHLFQ